MAEEQSGDDEQSKTTSVGERGVFGQKVEVTINVSQSHDIAEIVEKSTNTMLPNSISDDNNPQPGQQGESNNHAQQQPQPSSKKKCIAKAKLGWTHRFRFVVGIVHTNYEAYARQYGVGASLIAAPTVGAMSALTIRAHCHQVVKLSDTLSSFAPEKEGTCNVHGVRSKFLEGVDLDVLSSLPYACRRTAKEDGVDDAEAPSPVYFNGKLVWAKGFDITLELQDIF